MSEREGLSRRRVIQGAAWAAPVIMVATAAPARATSLENPLEGTTVSPPISSGNDDSFEVTVSLPSGVQLVGAMFTLNWDPTGSSKASASIDSGGVAWSPASSSDPSVTFAAPAGVIVSDGSSFTIDFSNGKTGTTWTGTLSGYVDGEYVSIDLAGTL